jgi:hypothetical protein
MSRDSDPRRRSAVYPMASALPIPGGAGVVGDAWMKARTVAAAAVQELANRRAFAWIHQQSSAPIALIDAVETDFQMVPYAAGGPWPSVMDYWHIPWSVQVGFDALEISGRLACPHDVVGALSLRCRAVNDEIDVASDYVLLASSQPPWPGRIFHPTSIADVAPTIWELAPFTVRLDLATLTTPRGIGLFFDVLYAPAYDPGTFELRVALHSILVSDEITSVEDNE